MRIACLVKPVPDPEYYNRISIDPVRGILTRAGIPVVMNPTDRHALEEAIRIKEKMGGEVVIFSMAPDDAGGILKDGLAMGADEAYLLSDRAFAGADTLATSYTLAKAIEQFGPFDIILAGNESADGSTSQVPPQVGVWLSMPSLAGIIRMEYGESFRVWCDVEEGRVEYEVTPPVVFAVKRGINTPRYIGIKGIMAAKSKKVSIIRVGDISVDLDRIGLNGSPTRAGRIVVPDIGRKGETITGSPGEIAEGIIEGLRKAGVIKEGMI
ncbi:MAG: electron transfer flavoprotein subunit beta/FixA family protein [Thermoanaerobacteraceae bacterium]|nr:electron transfer flavoprotein subunit beta/FixA family protein [Thermoanaerobacteraceae bacterium]